MRFNPLKSPPRTKTTITAAIAALPPVPVAASRQSAADQPPAAQSPALSRDAATPITITVKSAEHTKRHVPIWIAQLNQKADRAIYNEYAQRAKLLGGYYSRFGPIEMHGFIFFDEPSANKFAGKEGSLVQGFNGSAVPPVPAVPVVLSVPSVTAPESATIDVQSNVVQVTFTAPSTVNREP